MSLLVGHFDAGLGDRPRSLFKLNGFAYAIHWVLCFFVYLFY